MKALPQERRTLTDQEKLTVAEYKLKQFTVLLALVAKEIGQDKIIEIAKQDAYPKTDEQVKKMIEQGKGLKDLDRYLYTPDIDTRKFHAHNISKYHGDWVKWEDIKKLIG